MGCRSPWCADLAARSAQARPPNWSGPRRPTCSDNRLVQAAAEGDLGLGLDQDHVTVGVRDAENQDLGEERGDLARGEVHDREDQSTAQLTQRYAPAELLGRFQ